MTFIVVNGLRPTIFTIMADIVNTKQLFTSQVLYIYLIYEAIPTVGITSTVF